MIDSKNFLVFRESGKERGLDLWHFSPCIRGKKYQTYGQDLWPGVLNLKVYCQSSLLIISRTYPTFGTTFLCPLPKYQRYTYDLWQVVSKKWASAKGQSRGKQ